MKTRIVFPRPRRGLLILGALIVLGLAGCGKASPPKESKQLVLFTWAEMFPPNILDGFEKDTGYTINYTNFDFNETMLTKLETAGGAGYDLVIADDYIVETVIAKGLAQKLDKRLLGGYGNINPVYQGQFYDPADEYTIPYGAGVQTIVYDPLRVSIPITGYGDLWNEALADSLGIIDSYRVINGMALKVLGQSYNTGDIGLIRAAGEKLLALAPNIRLIRDDSLQNDLLSGEIAAAVMYTSQVTLAKLTNPDLRVIFPREGIGFGIMAAFIPSGAANPEAAHAFLDYIMDAKRGAECFEYLGYYSTYSASDPFISEIYKPLLTLPEQFAAAPASAPMAQPMEMIQTIGDEAVREHSRIWTAFKAAAGRN